MTIFFNNKKDAEHFVAIIDLDILQKGILMANKIVQLVDANDDNIFPLSSDPNAAHITMTTTDPGEGSTLGQNEFIAVYGGDPITMDYSTTEINTGAKWIDGSTIYKKTINFGAFPNATAKSVSHSISNLGWVVKTEIIGYDPSQGAYFPISYVDFNVLANSIAYFVSTSEVTVRAGADRSSITQSYVTLYYTKSSS